MTAVLLYLAIGSIIFLWIYISEPQLSSKFSQGRMLLNLIVTLLLWPAAVIAFLRWLFDRD